MTELQLSRLRFWQSVNIAWFSLSFVITMALQLASWLAARAGAKK